jgi:hypothetical protein
LRAADPIYGSFDLTNSFTKFFLVADSTYDFYEAFEDTKLTIIGSAVGTLAEGDVQITATSLSSSTEAENSSLTITVPITSASTWDNTVELNIDVNKFTVYNDEATNIDLGTQAVRGNNV